MRAEYRKVAEAHARSEADKQRLPLAKARANALKVDWSAYAPPRPTFLGTRVFENYDLADLARYIDWTPFFQTWELKGRYPGHPRRRDAGPGGAPAVRRRPGDAEADRRRGLVQAQGGHRLLARQCGRRRHPALRRRGRATRSSPTFFTLRQQLSKRDGRASLALADFVAPLETGPATTSAASW